jgi:hypothetical protein
VGTARKDKLVRSETLGNTSEDEDSLPDVAFAFEGQQLWDKRSRDDEYEARL